jgi:sugar-specific transcriptional regulator TrmB
MINESERAMIHAMKDVLNKFGIKLNQDIIQRKGGEEISDYSEVIAKTQERIDTLNKEAEDLFNETGMTQNEILEFGDNPKNFTDDEWQAISKVKEACDQYKKEISDSMAVIQDTDLSLGEPISTRKAKKTLDKSRNKAPRKKDWLSS